MHLYWYMYFNIPSTIRILIIFSSIWVSNIIIIISSRSSVVPSSITTNVFSISGIPQIIIPSFSFPSAWIIASISPTIILSSSSISIIRVIFNSVSSFNFISWMTIQIITTMMLTIVISIRKISTFEIIVWSFIIYSTSTFVIIIIIILAFTIVTAVN